MAGSRRHHRVAAAAVFALVAASGAASAQTSAPIDRLYVFGDSYSDGGNGYALTRKPATPPYASRYTNGPTAVEYMAKAFGLTLRYSGDRDLAADASLNFAVSGAWTGTRNNDAAIDGKTGLLSQVGGFEERVQGGKARFNADTTLFLIEIGTNDVLFGTINGQDAATLAANALQNVEKAVRSLHTAGARHIAIATLAKVERTPRAAALAPDKIKAVEAAALSLNRGYFALADKLRSELKADVFTLAWGQYLDRLMADPFASGLTNAGSCLSASATGGQRVCPDPDRYVFFDPLHPTTAAHKIIGHRLATEGGRYFVCPAGLKPGAVSGQPSCRFVAATTAAAAAAKACTRVAFRQTADMCNNCTAPPWSGEVAKSDGAQWTATFIEGHGRRGTARLRLMSQSASELVFFDNDRNLYTRFDLAAGKSAQRRGPSGDWTLIGEVLSTDCR